MIASSNQYGEGSGTNPSASARGETASPAPRDDDYRGENERPAGPALEERDLVGSDDVNDQRPGEERLDEPAGLEQGRVLPAIEYLQHMSYVVAGSAPVRQA